MKPIRATEMTAYIGKRIHVLYIGSEQAAGDTIFWESKLTPPLILRSYTKPDLVEVERPNGQIQTIKVIGAFAE